MMLSSQDFDIKQKFTSAGDKDYSISETVQLNLTEEKALKSEKRKPSQTSDFSVLLVNLFEQNLGVKTPTSSSV